MLFFVESQTVDKNIVRKIRRRKNAEVSRDGYLENEKNRIGSKFQEIIEFSLNISVFSKVFDKIFKKCASHQTLKMLKDMINIPLFMVCHYEHVVLWKYYCCYLMDECWNFGNISQLTIDCKWWKILPENLIFWP